MFDRVRHMLRKEFIQAFRDPKMKVLVFVAPVFQLLIFGYAVNTDVRDIAMAVHDLDRSETSRDLVARFERSGYFHVVEYASDAARASEILDAGEARAVLRFERGFERNLRAGRNGHVQLVIDGTDSMTASVVLNWGQAIVRRYSEEVAAKRIARSRGAHLPLGGIDLRARAWFNESLESRDFYIPGVFGLLVGLMTLMLTSMAVVREKEIGTMEQIMVTPITPAEFILGKTAPFAIVALADVVIVLVVGVLWFDVPVRGSVALLFVCMGLYAMTTIGVGLLISTISQTQQQAMITTFFFFMPAMLLSGFVFPIRNMPIAIQYVTLVNPMRYLFVIIRGIFLKGIGVAILWPQMLALGALGVLTLSIAVNRFRKTLA